MNSPDRFFATTAKGMEPLLAEELLRIGGADVADVKEERAGVSFAGALETAYRACLWSRVANRVLLPLKTFAAPDEGKLYGGIKSIRWADHLEATGTLAVDFASSRSRITHTHFGALKVKDAIVDQFRSIAGERPSIDLERPDIRVNVYLHEDRATVSLDLSGQSLHIRGYRERGVAAPLKENLAAAILLLAEWPKAAAEGHAFLDPMCGSGTLPIEAALMALDIAPGLRRSYYGFLKWRQHQPKIWEKLLAEARAREAAGRARRKLPRVVGYDTNFRAVRVALDNVERAGLRGFVHVEKKDFSEVQPLDPQGVLVMNPPYGERLGDTAELKPLYKAMGDTFKQRFKGWTGYIFTGSSELAKCVGLHASRRFVLFNGAIECRLLKYDLY